MLVLGVGSLSAESAAWQRLDRDPGRRRRGHRWRTCCSRPGWRTADAGDAIDAARRRAGRPAERRRRRPDRGGLARRPPDGDGAGLARTSPAGSTTTSPASAPRSSTPRRAAGSTCGPSAARRGPRAASGPRGAGALRAGHPGACSAPWSTPSTPPPGRTGRPPRRCCSGWPDVPGDGGRPRRLRPAGARRGRAEPRAQPGGPPCATPSPGCTRPAPASDELLLTGVATRPARAARRRPRRRSSGCCASSTSPNGSGARSSCARRARVRGRGTPAAIRARPPRPAPPEPRARGPAGRRDAAAPPAPRGPRLTALRRPSPPAGASSAARATTSR